MQASDEYFKNKVSGKIAEAKCSFVTVFIFLMLIQGKLEAKEEVKLGDAMLVVAIFIDNVRAGP